MQIKIIGELTIAEIRQAIFESLGDIESKYAIRYSAGATLFVNPTNGFGDRIRPTDMLGSEVKIMHSKGPYRSVAEDYEI